MKVTTLAKGLGHLSKCTSYLISELNNFDIKQIALSGQAFRFINWAGNPVTKDTKYDDLFCVSANGEYCEIYQCTDFIEIACTGDINDWLKYFDIIDCDGFEVSTYGILTDRILKSQDEPLKTALGDSSGIRILHQDFLEAGISFITSCANNIPRISKLINRLCKAYGNFIIKQIDDYEVSYWTFPSIESLRKVTEEDLRKLGFGFRAPHIIDFIRYYSALPTDCVPSFEDLQTIKGVGPKVANCISLYSLHDLDRVPMDVWMIRFQDELYGGKLPWGEFAGYQGICQQYLYYHYRNNNKQEEQNVRITANANGFNPHKK